MKVIIKNIWGKVIIEGEYNSFVEAVEKNKNNLSSADLYSADLSSSNLENINLEDAYLYNAKLVNANLYNANLENAYLYNANLENAYLYNAKLVNANLRYAKLVNIKGYVNSHDIFAEIVKRQGYKFWTKQELEIINFIWLWHNCWNDIKQQFGKKAMSVFKKLSKTGYNEWKLKYKEILTGGK